MSVSINTGSRTRARPLSVRFNTSRAEMFKVVFLGDSNVGKTCLAKLFVDRRTLEQSTATIGFDYHTLEVQLDEGARARLQIWDTAGMEKFRNAPALVPQYYHNTDGIVLVFDLSVRETFDGLENWISEMRQYCTGRSQEEKINMILVGNKLDLYEQRQVTRKAAQALADRYNMVAYIELSAKDINYLQLLENTFSTLARHMMKSREESEMKEIVRVTSQNKLLPKAPQLTEREGTGRASTSSAMPRVRRTIEKELPSTGSDWVVLSAPDEHIPDYVVSAQEKKRLEGTRCGC